jgi:hypothetical protein
MEMTVLDDGTRSWREVVMLSVGARIGSVATPHEAMAAPRPTGPDARRERKVRL